MQGAKPLETLDEHRTEIIAALKPMIVPAESKTQKEYIGDLDALDYRIEECTQQTAVPRVREGAVAATRRDCDSRSLHHRNRVGWRTCRTTRRPPI